MTNTIRTLLTDIIDYAGLFPPAKLDMQPAVEAYNRCVAGEHEWMLGRFICPLSRIAEFEHAASPFLPGTFATSGYRERAGGGVPWRLSVLIDPGPGGDITRALDEIDAFNQRHEKPDAGQAMIDMCEIKVASIGDVDPVLDQMPEEGLFPFIEFPVTEDCRGFVASLSGSAAGAKIRTGGVVGNAFPTVREVSAFLHACHAAEVPFKATAGLHHPVRGSHALTYEPGSAHCTMHGFINVFLAAVLINARGIDAPTTEALLSEEDPTAFRVADDVIGWRSYLVNAAEVAKAREMFALSFGSCSFDEPVADLRRMGLL